jgi:hypothetical protein
MKANLSKTLIFSLSVAVSLIPGCGGGMSKYEWLASESAPKGYPMQVLSGGFYDNNDGFVYIPSGKKMHNGWGAEVSHHIAGEDKKRLPSRFDILYFSYTENTFYEGEFNLPKDKIDRLFSQGYFSPKLDEDTTYRMFVVGVAPGGFVSVWVKGINKTTEIFSGKAKKTEIPWENVVSTKQFSRDEYIAHVLKREIGEKGIEDIGRNGIPFDLWERYSKRYRWVPVVSGVSFPKVLNSFKFFNGEKDYYSKALANDWSDEPKAVPSYMHFVWKHESDIPISLEVTFDEEEVLGAFEELSAKTQQPIEFNVNIREAEGKIFYRFILISGDDRIELQKGNYEQFRASMSEERLKKFLREN